MTTGFDAGLGSTLGGGFGFEAGAGLAAASSPRSARPSSRWRRNTLQSGALPPDRLDAAEPGGAIAGRPPPAAAPRADPGGAMGGRPPLLSEEEFDICETRGTGCQRPGCWPRIEEMAHGAQQATGLRHLARDVDKYVSPQVG